MSLDINLNINVEDVDYLVCITAIGDLEDDPETGGGIIPLEYSVSPTPESDDISDKVSDAIHKYMIEAIEEAIKKANEDTIDDDEGVT